MTLYIVRHGKTDWNNKMLIQGHTDIPLNEEGISAALKLALDIKDIKYDLCFSSPLKRAVETAKIITNNSCNIIITKELIERNCGIFEGTKVDFDIIARQWNYELDDKEGNIESVKECLKRAQAFLNILKNKKPDKNILIVSHGAFMKALHFCLIGYDQNTNFLTFSPENTKVYKYNL